MTRNDESVIEIGSLHVGSGAPTVFTLNSFVSTLYRWDVQGDIRGITMRH